MIVAPTQIRDVWLLTFEYDGVAFLGGLGRAVAMYAKALVKEGYQVTVFMPSHGRRGKPVEGFRACGSRAGVDGNRYSYCIGADEVSMNGVRVVLFKGLNPDTSRVLDSAYIYANVEEKISLYTRALIHWVDRFSEIPHLIHSNDWAAALGGVALKLLFEMRGYSIPFVYSIHLVSSRAFPWHYASSDWSGVPDVLHRVWRCGAHEVVSTKLLWDSVYGNVDHYAAIESDVLVSNSWSYMSEILNRFGRWMEEKTFVIHNVTDWRIEDVEREAEKLFGTRIRCEVRRRVVDMLSREAGVRRVGELRSCRFLVAAAGRITWSKGFDILIDALNYVGREVCVVVAGVTVGDYGYEELLSNAVSSKWGRVLILLDQIDQNVLKILIYASNVFVVPSRYEPFGIVSIEAQALGTPVIVSSAGGLPETVLDLRHDPTNGSGVVVQLSDLQGMGQAIDDLSHLTEYVDTGDRGVLSSLRTSWAAELVARNPHINVRENAIKWIDSRFRESRLRDLLKLCYEKARMYAYYRALTPL